MQKNSQLDDPTTPKLKVDKDPSLACPKCQSEWLEEVPVFRFKQVHSVVIGQNVPKVSDVGFYILRCVKCGETIEPNVLYGGTDALRREYETFLDHMMK